MRARAENSCPHIVKLITVLMPLDEIVRESQIIQMATADAASRVGTKRSLPWRKVGIALLLLFVAFLVFAWLRPLTVLRSVGRAVLWTAGIHSKYTQVGAYRVHYFEGGDGPPVVFVHGLGAESLNWVQPMIGFRRHFHVYGVDLLGHGQSEQPDIAYSIEQQSEMLRLFLATQHLSSADFVGVSMGGWIVLKLATEHPEVVNRLVIADAAGLRFSTTVSAETFLPRTPTEVTAFMALLTPRQYKLPSPVVRDFLHQVARNAWIIRRIFASFFTYQDVLDGRLQSVNIPVLIIWGKEDRLIPPSVGDRMKLQLPRSSLVLCSDAGHLAIFECWNKIEPEVLTFLSAPEPPPSYVLEVASGQ
jgi:pimeloyl-ACP methyl ester carboxylesterase